MAPLLIFEEQDNKVAPCPPPKSMLEVFDSPVTKKQRMTQPSLPRLILRIYDSSLFQ
jgi:hypothetical protein